MAMPGFGRQAPDQRHVLHFEGDRTASALNQPYSIKLDDGSVVQGITSRDGGTEHIQRDVMQLAQLGVLKTLLGSAAPTGEAVVTTVPPTESNGYDLAFLIRNKQTGAPLSDVKYRVQLESGDVVVGMTDAEGRTQLVHSDTPQIASIQVPYDDDDTTQPHTRGGQETCDC